MLCCLFLLCLWAVSAACAPTNSNLGISFEKRQNGLPLLTLPYGTWRAASYNRNADVYTFKNIRFAAPPVGDLRWAKPAPPAKVDGIQDGSYGPSCVQAAPAAGLNLLGPGNQSPVGGTLNQFLAGIPVALFNDGAEDCLFLDLYVPGKAIRNPSSKLSVVVWIYGGAYVFGSKDALDGIGFYEGTGPIQQSGGNIIFVAGNYRLGTYGFLTGQTMENEGLPNAGLYDQRAVFQWVQDHIHLVGGDKTQVSAWGESAGAGSILHHLTAFGGTQDPLFKRAVTQSPAFQFMWDRHGETEDVFKSFTALAGCAGQGVACLRRVDAATLDKANQALISKAVRGTFNVGPAADGRYVRQLAALELASGSFWKGLESMIVSHTKDEAELFVDGHIQTDKQFSDFLDKVFPGYSIRAGIGAAIAKFYPPVSTDRTYRTQTDRVKSFVRDSSFTCNSRFLTAAYAGKTYNMQYSVTPGWHATDLLPTFYSAYVKNVFDANTPFPLIAGFGSFAAAYQSYLTLHARTGNPNSNKLTLNIPPAITWPKAGKLNEEDLGSVLNAGDWGFSYITDKQMPKSHCDFILQVAAAVTNIGGYAAPGTAQPQKIAVESEDPSRNYS